MSSSPRDPAERAVAVVGLGAILPDALNVRAFWENVLSGRNCISEVPRERWDPADYYDPDPKVIDKTYSKIGGWVRGFSFDPVRFRIPPKVAAAMDEGQHWMVAAAAEALKDAGHPDRPLDLDSTGVIVGNAMGGERHYITTSRLFAPEFRHALEATPAFRSLPAAMQREMMAEFTDQIVRRLPETTEDTMPGELANIMAGRVAAVFNLRGPNFTSDAACASSFAALQAAIDGLVDHHYDAVLSGGMDRNMGASTFIKFCKIGALSPDGSRPYAKGANGFVMGEGGALFVLKRLEDAERAGDRIYAVIRAIGGSSDGKGKSITAPNPAGQVFAIRRAWERAGLPITSVSLIEGHGTSTAVGDVSECTSITSVLASAGLPKASIALGSVKSQIGHLKAGAGAAGLLKAVLALHHKTIPASINFKEPNPDIQIEKTPFWVPLQAQPWERPAGGLRRVGVSAFGFGGTNFHVVLEEHVPGLLTRRKPIVQVPSGIGGGSEPGKGSGTNGAARASSSTFATQHSSEPSLLGNLLSLGAENLAELRSQLANAVESARKGVIPARRTPPPELRTARERLVISFDSAADLVKLGESALAAFDKGDGRSWRLLSAKGVHRGTGSAGKVAFLYPGQGSQYVNMLAELRRLEPVVAETFAEADEVMRPILGRRLSEYLFVDSKDSAVIARAEEELRATVITQPAVLTCGVALTRLLACHGIKPDLVMGHSLGEWAALIAAGMLPFADGLVAVSSRARGMASVAPPDPGKMASVLGPYDQIAKRLAEMDGYVVAANINSRNQTVIAGETDAVLRAVDQFKGLGFTAQILPVSHAFHSRIVAAASGPLRKVLESIAMRSPQVPIVSNVDGELYPDDIEKIRDQLSIQLASPVQWVKSLETAYREGARVFVEVGPKRVLRGLAEDVLGDREGLVFLSTNHPKRGDVWSFHEGLCGLFAAGLPATARSSELSVAPSLVSPVSMKSNAHEATSSSAAAFGVQNMSHSAPPVPLAVAQTAAGSSGPDYAALGRVFARCLEEGLALYQGQGQRPAAADPRFSGGTAAYAPAVAAKVGSVVITGAGLGLPGKNRRVFDDTNIDRILAGDSFIDPVSDQERQKMLEKNIVRLVKREVGEPSLDPIRTTDEVLKLAAQKGAFDLVREYGVDPDRIDALDVTTQLAMGAGIEALRDARIPLVRKYRRTTTGSRLPDRWLLPTSLADETGVVFSSAFPAQNALVEEIEKFQAEKLRRMIIAELAKYASDNPRARTRIAELEAELSREGYVFSRKLLFKALAMGHSQFAELLGARGPNTLINSACASATQAVGIATDWIKTGRCRRVIIITADDCTSERLFQWIGSGFLASGAASTEERVELAALPFDRRRNGTLLGMGAGALVVESQDALEERGVRGVAEVLGTECANSAFHGTRLDVEHISEVMERVVRTAEKDHGVSRSAMAQEMMFMSHETYTPARGGSAAAEVNALKRVFGSDSDKIVVANTKGYTGHPMGVAIEDVVALKAIERQIVPPVPNFREPDPELGSLNLSRGGHYPVRYALRFAAGFGSQLSLTLTRRVPGCEERIAQPAVYERWLSAVSGYRKPVLEVELRTLRVRDMGAPEQEPIASTWSHGVLPQAVIVPTPADEQATLRSGIGSPSARYSAPAGAFGTTVASRPSEVPVAVPAVVPAAQTFAGAGQTLAAAAMAATPATAPTTKPAAASADAVAERVLALVSEKTGYPRDMLDLELDLEADLGIDTVKQAEVFALVRDTFEIPRQDNVKLRDYPTLKHVIGFVRQHRPDLAVAPAEAVPAAAMPAPAPAAPFSHAPAAGTNGVASAPTADLVTERVLMLVSEKTGYPRDMLDLELDLEADLGIDTVKQAEVFALVRDTFEIPRQDNIKLRDYPTLKHVIGFVRQNRPDLAAVPAQASAPVAPPQAAPLPAATTATSSAVPVTAAASEDEVTARVLGLVSEKTGYPRDMLELDLDLEADLGIDTVKQAEVFALVRDAFEIPRQDNVKLRDYPTLKHVIGFVRQYRPDLAPAPSAAAVASVAAGGTTPLASAPATQAPVVTASAGAPASATVPVEDEITSRVLELVSEKTGYPRDMLELELDLEADLGIDTVKQAEVFALVREAFQIGRQDSIKLRDYPTLKHVIGFVRENLPKAASSDTSAITEQAAADATSTKPESATGARGSLLRIPVPVLRPSFELCKPTSARLDASRRVLIVSDRGGVGAALAETLRSRGIDVTVFENDLSYEDAQAKTADWVKGGEVGGVYFLSALDPTPAIEEIEPQVWRDLDRQQVKLLCGVTRSVYDSLSATGTFLISGTRLGGLHGYEPSGATSPVGGAVTGFTKAMARERAAAVVKAVDFSPNATPPDIAQALIAETERDPDAFEVGHRDGSRFAIGAIPSEIAPVHTAHPMQLDESRVFVVTGGAGAITSAIVLDLVKASRATFHLLDLLPAPDDATRREIDRLITDREALKRDIFDRIKAEQGRATPAQVEKRLFELERSAAIIETMRGIEAAGGKAFYHGVNVTSTEGMAAAIEAVTQTSGHIDVLLHTAGLERSRTFDTKPQEEFDRVYGVKVDGLYNLLRATRSMPIGALIVFSSVAGRFGNAGQADYSAANDLMCKVASSFRASHPNSLAVAFDWSAWGGIGMATRGSVPEMMRRAGIEMLDPNEATPLVRQALTTGMSSEAVVGRTLGVLLEAQDADGGLDSSLAARLAAGGVEGRLPVESIKVDKHSGVEVAVTLDPRKEPFLYDHQIDGTPVLPGVMGLELFAEAATLLAPGYRVRSMDKVRFQSPLKYYRHEPRTAVVRVLPFWSADGTVRARCTLHSSQTLAGGHKQEKEHFVGEIVLDNSPVTVSEAPKANGTKGSSKKAKASKSAMTATTSRGSIDRDAIYRVYFHGPAYQVLSKVDLRTEGAIVGALSDKLPADRSDVGSSWLFAPRLIELCFQTAGVYEIGLTGRMGLPAAVDRAVVREVPAASASLVAEIRAKGDGNGNGALEFEARVRGTDGKVYVELEGYRTSTLPGGVPEAELLPFRAVGQRASASDAAK